MATLKIVSKWNGLPLEVVVQDVSEDTIEFMYVLAYLAFIFWLLWQIMLTQQF